MNTENAMSRSDQDKADCLLRPGNTNCGGCGMSTGLTMLGRALAEEHYALVIPACRKFEARWRYMSDTEAADPEFASSFRRDQIVLWLLAIGLPFALTGLFRGIAAAG